MNFRIKIICWHNNMLKTKSFVTDCICNEDHNNRKRKYEITCSKHSSVVTP